MTGLTVGDTLLNFADLEITDQNGTALATMAEDCAITISETGLIPPFNPPNAYWQIAFVSERDGNPEIYVMNANGSAVRRVTQSDAQDIAPDWRPGHDQLVFTSDRDGNAELYAINSDGTGLLRLTTNAMQDYDPACSPDGTQMLFVSDRDGNPEIYVMAMDTNNVLRLTDHSSADMSPAWSPNGAEIAFVSNRNGNSEIFIMNADGTNIQQISNTFGATNWYPAWSPKTNALSVTSQNDNLADIYAMNTQGEDIRRLTEQGDRVTRTDWSPDGGWIAFASERDGDSDLYVLNVADLAVFRLTDHTAADYAPVWRALNLAPCAIRAERENVAIRVGPGRQRGIFDFLPVNQDFTVIGQAKDNAGIIWWQLDKEEITNSQAVTSLWISSEDVVSIGACAAVPLGEVPPFIPGNPPPSTSMTSTPRPPGEWGPCGSCDTCGHSANECVTAPDGQCLWDPGFCQDPPDSTPPPNSTDVPGPMCYTLSVSVSPPGSGTVSYPGGRCGGVGNSYPPGTGLSLQANGNPGCFFSNWTGSCGSGSSNPISITMNSNCAMTANFSCIN